MKPAKRPPRNTVAPKDEATIPQDSEAVIEEKLLHVQHSRYQGPLPDPQTFKSYDLTVPGAAERILVMAEQSAAHAREMDKTLLQAQVDSDLRSHSEAKHGQYFAIISVLAMAGVAVYALKLGYPTVAGIICSTTVVGLVAAFVTSRLKPQASGATDTP